MNSLLRGLMASDGNTNRPLPSLILLGIVDFCCILIGLEQINVHKISSGAIWIAVGVGSGLIGYYWSQIKRAIASVGTWFRKKPSKLVIHWANYRAVEDGGNIYDVADFLRQIISGDSLVIDVENHNFVIGDKNFVPHDPLPFKPKRLQVNYSYGGQPAHTVVRHEHGRLLLPEDSLIKYLVDELAKLKAAQPSSTVGAGQARNTLISQSDPCIRVEVASIMRDELRRETSFVLHNDGVSTAYRVQVQDIDLSGATYGKAVASFPAQEAIPTKTSKAAVPVIENQLPLWSHDLVPFVKWNDESSTVHKKFSVTYCDSKTINSRRRQSLCTFALCRKITPT